jgi:hypothetical protein
VTRQAVVRHQPKVIRQSDGSETVATIALTFPSSFAVGSRDRFTVAGVAYLPQRLDYMPDPETGLPYFVEAWL